jgi:hypothetical protein
MKSRVFQDSLPGRAVASVAADLVAAPDEQRVRTHDAAVLSSRQWRSESRCGGGRAGESEASTRFANANARVATEYRSALPHRAGRVRSALLVSAAVRRPLLTRALATSDGIARARLTIAWGIALLAIAASQLAGALAGFGSITSPAGFATPSDSLSPPRRSLSAGAPPISVDPPTRRIPPSRNRARADDGSSAAPAAASPGGPVELRRATGACSPRRMRNSWPAPSCDVEDTRVARQDRLRSGRGTEVRCERIPSCAASRAPAYPAERERHRLV